MNPSTDILNAIEKSELQAFADNPTLFEAVKKVLLHSVYFQGTLVEGEDSNPALNFALQLVAGAAGSKTNEEVGAQLRARWEGVNFVEAGFQDLATFKTQVAPPKGGKNPAR